MKGKTWYWIIGLFSLVFLACGGFVGLGLLVAGQFDNGSEWGFGFGQGIAIVDVEGVIVPGEAPPPSPFSVGPTGVAYSQTVIDHLQRAKADENVKAIVLRVDSPGGSVFASDEIYQELKEVDKPIITAMGNVAASGGYFVAAPTDEIWASPLTLTCSVGAVMRFFNLEQFSEEYGVTAITISSGQFKDTGNPFREFTEEDRAILQSMVDEAYDAFVGVVAEGRGMTDEQVREIADGRICTGRQAQAMGLVDKLGYLPAVIDRAAELGGIANGDHRIIEYSYEAGFMGQLTASLYRPSPVEELKQLLRFDAGSPLMYLYLGP
jgi:protease-4